MKTKTIIKLLAAFIMIASFVCIDNCYPIDQGGSGDPGMPEYAPGEVLVKFREGTDPGTVLEEVGIEAAAVERVHSIKPAVSKYRKFLKESLRKNADGLYQFRDKVYKSVEEVDDVGEEELFEEAYKKMSPIEQGLYRSYKIVLPEGISAEEATGLLKGHPDIEYAELNYIMRIMQ